MSSGCSALESGETARHTATVAGFLLRLSLSHSNSGGDSFLSFTSCISAAYMHVYVIYMSLCAHARFSLAQSRFNGFRASRSSRLICAAARELDMMNECARASRDDGQLMIEM